MSSNVKAKDHAKSAPAKPRQPSDKSTVANKENAATPPRSTSEAKSGPSGFKAKGKPAAEHTKPAAPRPKAPPAEYTKPAVKRKGEKPSC